MTKNILVKKVTEIEMPEDMQHRIIKNCYNEMEKNSMKNKNIFFKRPMVAVASFALCLCLAGASALAATGKLEGFFKDIKNWDGAVTGTVYEQATDEVQLDIIEVSDKLAVEITMMHSDKAPYSFFELFGIKEYKIVDKDGNVIVENENLEMSVITGDKVWVNLPLEKIGDGEYKLIVKEFVGSSKGDQPLPLTGVWECDFTR